MLVSTLFPESLLFFVKLIHENQQLIDNTTGVDHEAFEISGTVLYIPRTQASFQHQTALNFIYM